MHLLRLFILLILIIIKKYNTSGKYLFSQNPFIRKLKMFVFFSEHFFLDKSPVFTLGKSQFPLDFETCCYVEDMLIDDAFIFFFFFICPDSPMNIILELWVGVVIGNCSWLLTLSLRNWVQWFMFKRLSVCDHFCQNTNVRTVNYSVECSCKHVEMTALYWWLRRSTC